MRFRRTRNVTAQFVGLALMASLAACGNDSGASEGGSDQITIATVAADSGAQGFLAKEKGFYRAHGLNVKVQLVAGVPELAAAVQSGSAEFALTSPTSVASASASGIPFQIVAPGVKYTKQKPGTFLMIAERAKDVRGVQDLAGESVAVNALNTLPHLSTMATLDDAGVDPKSVNYVVLDFPEIGQALESGQVSAGAVVSPFEVQLETTNIARRVVSPYDAVNDGQDFLNTVWFGTEDYIEANPDVVKKFRAAILDTTKWANNPANTAERKAVLQEYTDLPDSAMRPLELAQYGTRVTPELIQPLLDVMLRFQALQEPMQAESIISGSG